MLEVEPSIRLPLEGVVEAGRADASVTPKPGSREINVHWKYQQKSSFEGVLDGHVAAAEVARCERVVAVVVRVVVLADALVAAVNAKAGVVVDEILALWD